VRARSAAGATLAAAALLAAGCGGGDSGGAPSPSANATAAAPKGHAGSSSDAAAKLTLRQAIGQHMVFAYSGATPPAALVKRIGRGEAADVRRLPGPPAASATRTQNAAQAKANGRAAGRLLHGAGVNVDFAPVVDVARAGAALEAEGRTYGRDAATVTQRAGAFAQGLQQAGVAAVLKHWPGFGAATINTDDGAARVDLPLSTLRSVDRAPYKRLKPDAVMVSTAIYPRVDPRPAAFSPRWVNTELRKNLDFDGVVVTDDLQGGGVKKFGTFAQLAFFALRAGVDLPLFAQDYTAGARAATGLERAVKSGALPRADLDAGVRRVLNWRLQLPKAKNDN
jgi:beta-N-acetylhexosaminidase